MDLKPVPSKMSNARHAGSFSLGTALSTVPDIKPLDPSPVKTIQLDTNHKVIEIALGVKFSAWTFGDQVPGPVIRFANASQGAVGLIDAGRPPEDKGNIEHHNMPATLTPNDPEAVKGKVNFESKSLACHSIGQGRKLGPDLAGVTKRRSNGWLTKCLQLPEKMLASDADGQTMQKEYEGLPMPNQNLSDAEIRQYIKYFQWADEQGQADAEQTSELHRKESGR